MKLQNIFSQQNSTQIYQAVYQEWWDEIEELEWLQLEGDILTKEITLEKILDGDFLLRGVLVNETESDQICWIHITMPEGIVGSTYLLGNNESLEKFSGLNTNKGRAVPLVPIEKYIGDYEIYLSKPNAEIGLSVLKKGLEFSTEKWFYAFEIGCILRDEKRFSEAIEYFKIISTAECSEAIKNSILKEIEFIKQKYL